MVPTLASRSGRVLPNRFAAKSCQSALRTISFKIAIGISPMSIRLGDIIDDFCVKCKRLTNHHVVSIVEEAPAKVRCCSCYHDHDYRHEQPEPKKPTKKQLEEENQKAKDRGNSDSDEVDDEETDDEEEDDDEVAVAEEDFVADDDGDDSPSPRRARR